MGVVSKDLFLGEFILAVFGAFNYRYPDVIFFIWVKGLDKKCVVRGVVSKVLFLWFVFFFLYIYIYIYIFFFFYVNM